MKGFTTFRGLLILLIALMVISVALAQNHAKTDDQEACDEESQKTVPAGSLTGSSLQRCGAGSAQQATKEQFLDELLTILNETKSSDTFLVTLSLLRGLHANRWQVIPIAIRNAERLNLFSDVAVSQRDDRGAGKDVADLIASFFTKKRAQCRRPKDSVLDQPDTPLDACPATSPCNPPVKDAPKKGGCYPNAPTGIRTIGTTPAEDSVAPLKPR